MTSDKSPSAPRFSILLPTHNRADVLSYAIRSALWQTEQDFELLIVGDGCTDGTADLVASFEEPRIRWFDLPKEPGIGYANRNVALRAARGAYVAYLAHDDIWFPDHLQRLGSLLERTRAEFAYSRGLAVDLRGRMTPYWYNLGIPRHQEGLWRGHSAITMCAVVHTRACLDKYGFWDEVLLRGADVVMWHRILASANFRNLVFISEPTSLHFVARWRVTTSYRRRMRVVGGVLDRFLEDMLPTALRLPSRAGQTQQETAWVHLSRDPSTTIQGIRQAVVQLQDALLWQGRTVGGFIGLRVGLAVGATADWLWNSVQWISSGEARRRLKRLQDKTRPIESARLTGRYDKMRSSD